MVSQESNMGSFLFPMFVNEVEMWYILHFKVILCADSLLQMDLTSLVEWSERNDLNKNNNIVKR